jgi:hypothetical protein
VKLFHYSPIIVSESHFMGEELQEILKTAAMKNIQEINTVKEVM